MLPDDLKGMQFDTGDLRPCLLSWGGRPPTPVGGGQSPCIIPDRRYAGAGGPTSSSTPRATLESSPRRRGESRSAASLRGGAWFSTNGTYRVSPSLHGVGGRY